MVEDARLTLNNAGRGGDDTHGGAGNAADLVLTRVRLTYNGASGVGGRVGRWRDGGEVNVTVSGSIIDHNSASDGGGGVALDSQGGEARLTIDASASSPIRPPPAAAASTWSAAVGKPGSATQQHHLRQQHPL